MSRLLNLIIRRHGLEGKQVDDPVLDYFRTNYPDDYLFWVSNVSKSDRQCKQSEMPHSVDVVHSTEDDKDPERVFDLSTTESVVRDAVKKLSE